MGYSRTEIRPRSDPSPNSSLRIRSTVSTASSVVLPASVLAKRWPLGYGWSLIARRIANSLRMRLSACAASRSKIPTCGNSRRERERGKSKAKKLQAHVILSFFACLMLGCDNPAARNADPPIIIRAVDLDARVDSECVRRFDLNDPNPLKGDYQLRLRSEIEALEFLENKHPGGSEGGRKRSEIIAELEKLDRALSQCKADRTLREEVVATMRKEAEKGRAEFKAEYERGERYKRALEKCGAWKTEDEQQAVLRCMNKQGF